MTTPKETRNLLSPAEQAAWKAVDAAIDVGGAAEVEALRALRVIQQQEAVEVPRCTLPPPGWRCTRTPPHDGPCAAVPEADVMRGWFVTHADEHGQFDRVPPERRLSTRPDLCAFLWLDRLVPGDHDMVSAAEHDEIFLHVDPEALFLVATEEDIVTLLRCGVMYDEETDSLAMFV